MEFTIDKILTIRPITSYDFSTILNLTLKKDDVLELDRMLGISTTEYFKWHLDNHKDTTNVVIYKGKIVGILCLSNETNNLAFMTTEVDGLGKFLMIKYFNKVLDTILEQEGKDYCIVYVDKEYTASLKWAKRKGFITISESEVNGNKFETLRYSKRT